MIMTLPVFTMRQLLEAGVHFGHHTRRWNPLMKPFIFGVRNNVHIIDLEQTVPMLHQAMSAVRDVAANGGRVLFVGTKRQAQDKVAAAAQRCGQYYVNHRWLGGMLTNWKTMSLSIKRLRELDEQQADHSRQAVLTKKELLQLSREREKLDRALGGITEMGGLPDILFIIDVPREELAIQEATKLKIPVVAICDSNANPNGVTYAVPGNDDALRAIELYCDLIAGSVLDGLQAELMASGVDVGESEDVPDEELPSVDAEMIAAAEPDTAQPAA
jgi:small subunit ribosomal protein S2